MTRKHSCRRRRTQAPGGLLTGIAAATLLAAGAVPQEVAVLDESAFVEDLTEISATIMDIDSEDRLVALRAEDGREFIVQAADDVPLDRVEVGDNVDVAYYEALAAEITSAPTGEEPALVGSTVAPIDERGRATGLVYTAVVEIDEVDTENNLVAFTTPAGEPREVNVERPELQRFIGGLEEGDHVQLTYGEALAVSVTPVETDAEN